MGKSLIFFITAILVLSTLGFISAQSETCFNTEIPSSSSEFFSQITNLNSALSKCPVEIPGSIDFLVGNGNILASITSNSGNVENFYVVFENNNLTSIMAGATEDYEYELITNESTVNKILNSENIQENILTAYNNKELEIKPKGLVNKVKWFLGKLFIPKSSS